MTNSELDRLRRKHRDFVSSRLDAEPEEVPDSFFESFDSITVDDARRLDKFASQRSSFIARLTGENVKSGSIDAEVLNDVVSPLRLEVASASGSGPESTRLELVGIGPGSAVLHFEPVAGSLADDDAGRQMARVDSAIGRVLEAHRFIEENGDVRQLRNQFGDLLDGLGKLTSAMLVHEVELDLVWRSPAGVTTSPVHLGQRGLSYAKRVFERMDFSESVDAEGFVYGVSLTGELVIKRNLSKPKSATFHVRMDPETIAGHRFGLGDFVRVELERRSTRDLTGREYSFSYHLQNVLHHQSGLDAGVGLIEDDGE